MSEQQLDRLARGELTSSEGRQLAQQALDEPALFDEATYIAIARTALVRNPPRKAPWWRVGMLAAAAALIVGVVLFLPRPQPQPQAPSAPVLLASAAPPDTARFRGAESDSREPRITGSIATLADGVASIDLGSLDGLAKDAEVAVLRDGQPVGTIRLTTIFRDRARGQTAGTAIRVNDQVRVPPSAALRATLDRIDAALARGDVDSARSLARQASLGSFDAELSTAADLNNAAVIAELHANPGKAAELYRRALEAKPSAPDRQAIEQNLARLKGVH